MLQRLLARIFGHVMQRLLAGLDKVNGETANDDSGPLGCVTLGLGGSLLDSLNQPLSPTGRGYFTTSLSGQDVMLNFVAVPEPSTLVLLGIAAAFLAVRRRAAR